MYFLNDLLEYFMDWLQSLESEMELFKAEYAKFGRGTKIAGTRARKHLQNIKKAAQELRSLIQGSKKEEGST
jgi:hypothetical protein